MVAPPATAIGTRSRDSTASGSDNAASNDGSKYTTGAGGAAATSDTSTTMRHAVRIGLSLAAIASNALCEVIGLLVAPRRIGVAEIAQLPDDVGPDLRHRRTPKVRRARGKVAVLKRHRRDDGLRRVGEVAKRLESRLSADRGVVTCGQLPHDTGTHIALQGRRVRLGHRQRIGPEEIHRCLLPQSG